jgi:flavin-dependent dehydrogenase
MSAADVVIVGGGPAGLATAIEAAQQGLSVRVLERNTGIPDKACGEGIMPEGAEWLRSRRVAAEIDPAWCSEFVGIRYVQNGLTCAEARFRKGPGLGVRRLALAHALEARAAHLGVVVEHGVAARFVSQDDRGVRAEADGEPIDAALVVAADGLASPWRAALGLDPPTPEVRRFGQRRHFEGTSPGEFVEVHWSDGVEAYLTPTGTGRCGLAFLWESLPDQAARFDDLLARFPAVRERVESATVISDVRGAGPLARTVRSCVAGRVVLIGDAAGYVDAITGEGLSLAFASASALAPALRSVLDGDTAALEPYARAHARLFRRYALTAGAMVWLSRRPAWRRQAFALLRRAPFMFEQALSLVG